MIQSPLLTTFSFINHAFGTLADDKIPSDVVTVKQVHGTYLYFVEEDREIEKPGYDILMTEKKGTRIGVKTADCLPILMVEPKKRIIVAAHAGWRVPLKICLLPWVLVSAGDVMRLKRRSPSRFKKNSRTTPLF
ncbi:MAG: polyphenol oxidase family protein [Deltaproteobacteria bacterium]|nr:polyphenol oxidase family protein [Deltaproteobacteria bacterium]